MESTASPIYPESILRPLLGSAGDLPAAGSVGETGQVASFRAPGLCVCDSEDLAICEALGTIGCPMTVLGLSPSTLAKARAVAPEAREQLGSLERTGLSDASVSALVLAETVLDRPDANRLLTEAVRILRPDGGLLLLSNRIDGEDGWVRALEELLEEPAHNDVIVPDGFTLEDTRSEHVSRSGTRQALLDYARQSAKYLQASSAAKKELLRRISALHEYGSLAGAETFPMSLLALSRRLRVRSSAE